MVSLARVIPEAALFAFGALTLMFARGRDVRSARSVGSRRSTCRRARASGRCRARSTDGSGSRARLDGRPARAAAAASRRAKPTQAATRNDQRPRHNVAAPRRQRQSTDDPRDEISSPQRVPGCVACHACGRVSRARPLGHARSTAGAAARICTRAIRTASMRTWALLIAAALLVYSGEPVTR